MSVIVPRCVEDNAESTRNAEIGDIVNDIFLARNGINEKCFLSKVADAFVAASQKG